MKVFTKKTKKDFLDHLAEQRSLEELGIDKAIIQRTIQSLKANYREITPANLAIELGIPRSYIYDDLEILESIYRECENLTGHDSVIQGLIKDLKSKKRKITKLSRELEKSLEEKEKSYNDGFVQGAAMNFSNSQDEAPNINSSKRKELWARGVLFIDGAEDLDVPKIKKAYKLMVTLIHPDSSGKETNEMMNSLQEAYNYLLAKYS